MREGSPSASRFALAVRRKSRRVPPSGPRLRRPASEGPPKSGRLSIALRAGSGSDWGFSTRLLLRENGRPSWPAPCGPCPVEALACATGPEGGTRRLFPTARRHVDSAPLAIGMGKASCGVAAPIGNASCSVVMRLPRLAFAVARSRLSLANCVVVAAVGCGSRINVAQRRWSACWREPCVALSLRDAARVTCEGTVAFRIASGALDPTHLRLRKSRRVSPSGPVA
jgi:hypothetical protein